MTENRQCVRCRTYKGGDDFIKKAVQCRQCDALTRSARKLGRDEYPASFDAEPLRALACLSRADLVVFARLLGAEEELSGTVHEIAGIIYAVYVAVRDEDDTLERAQKAWEVVGLEKFDGSGDREGSGTELGSLTVADVTDILRREVWRTAKEMASADLDVAVSEAQARVETAQKSVELAFDRLASFDLVAEARAAVAAAVPKRIEVKVGDAEVVELGETVLPEEFTTVLALAQARKNVFLVGPTGCGKTHMCAELARALRLDFAAQSMSEGVSESAFYGYLIPVGEQGQMEYVPVPFVKIVEEGGVFLLDEMDKADPNLLAAVNSLLANGYMYLPQRVGNPLLRRHKDCVIVAAANTYGTGGDAMYVSNQLSAETLDRFHKVEMDYSAEVEEKLVDKEVLEWGLPIRAKIREKDLRRAMSTRVLLDFTDMKRKFDWGRDEWERLYFCGWNADERALVS